MFSDVGSPKSAVHLYDWCSRCRSGGCTCTSFTARTNPNLSTSSQSTLTLTLRYILLKLSRNDIIKKKLPTGETGIIYFWLQEFKLWFCILSFNGRTWSNVWVTGCRSLTYSSNQCRESWSTSCCSRSLKKSWFSRLWSFNIIHKSA